MSETGEPTELERALARPDVETLRAVIAEHFAWKQAHDAGLDSDSTELDPDIFDDSDPERSLALIAVAMATYDDERYLGLVSAGLLEDLFFNARSVPPALISRIELEAARNPRFRWMLSGVWTDSFLPESRELVERLTEGVDFEAGLAAVESR